MRLRLVEENDGPAFDEANNISSDGRYKSLPCTKTPEQFITIICV